MATREGLTLLESVFSIVIISGLLLASLGSFQSYQRRSNISATAHELIGYLERARVLSTVSYGGFRYGVHFEQTQYTLFRAPTYQPGALGNEIRQLSGFRFADPNVWSNGQGGFTQDLLFAGLSGQTTNTGTIRLESTADPNFFRLITVNSLGTALIQ